MIFETRHGVFLILDGLVYRLNGYSWVLMSLGGGVTAYLGGGNTDPTEDN